MTKTVWITGASSGIGEALAKKYNSEGHNIVISARNEVKLNSLKNTLINHENSVLVLPLDLSDYKDFDSIAQKVIDRFGSIDILINNGGISQRSLAVETNIDVTKKIFEVNVFGTIALTKSALKDMVLKESGSIVVISSLVGKFGTPFRSSYSASKHALHGYYDSLRAELSESINVTIICPGFVNTNVSLNALTATGEVQGSMDEATGKAMSPSDFANKAFKVIENKVEEASIGGKEIVGVYLKRFVPWLFSKIIKKAKVK